MVSRTLHEWYLEFFMNGISNVESVLHFAHL